MCSDNDILNPEQVASLMPPPITISWVYTHWEELGGTKIGRRNVILKGVLYANLQGKGVLVCKNREGREEMDPQASWHDTGEVEEEKRGQTGRGRAKAKGGAIKKHPNRFGLVDALQ